MEKKLTLKTSPMQRSVSILVGQLTVTSLQKKYQEFYEGENRTLHFLWLFLKPPRMINQLAYKLHQISLKTYFSNEIGRNRTLAVLSSRHERWERLPVRLIDVNFPIQQHVNCKQVREAGDVKAVEGNSKHHDLDRKPYLTIFFKYRMYIFSAPGAFQMDVVMAGPSSERPFLSYERNVFNYFDTNLVEIFLFQAKSSKIKEKLQYV